METTGIDLTKCNNCLFRAVYNGRPVSGTVKVVEEWCNLIFDGGIVSVRVSGLPEDSGIADFKIVPRDPETYEDWQVGDKVHYPNGDNDIVIFRSGELVVLADDFTEENSDVTAVNTCSQLFDRREGRLVLTDIERQIIEEKRKQEYEPQDGDVCFVRTAAGNCFIFIKREHKPDEEIHSYACFDTNLWSLCPAKVSCVCDRQSIRELRLATEDEKQKLFNAMAKQGKRWNAEKKSVEDIPKPYEFKKGDPVLVRAFYDKTWGVGLYDAESNNADMPYWVYVGYKKSCYSECIPYNEKTMHLLGTTEDYKEE